MDSSDKVIHFAHHRVFAHPKKVESASKVCCCLGVNCKIRQAEHVLCIKAKLPGSIWQWLISELTNLKTNYTSGQRRSKYNQASCVMRSNPSKSVCHSNRSTDVQASTFTGTNHPINTSTWPSSKPTDKVCWHLIQCRQWKSLTWSGVKSTWR